MRLTKTHLFADNELFPEALIPGVIRKLRKLFHCQLYSTTEKCPLLKYKYDTFNDLKYSCGPGI